MRREGGREERGTGEQGEGGRKEIDNKNFKRYG